MILNLLKAISESFPSSVRLSSLSGPSLSCINQNRMFRPYLKSKDVLGLVSSAGEKSTYEKNSIIDGSVVRAAPPPFTFDNWIRSSILPTPY